MFINLVIRQISNYLEEHFDTDTIIRIRKECM